MKRFFRFIVLFSAMVLVVLLAVPVSAIQNGSFDDDSHPYVCLVVFYDTNQLPLWRTTGELISPNVLLTAGHGTDGAALACVWFEANINPENSTSFPYAETGYPYYGGGTSFTGIPYTNPGYRAVPEPGLPGFDYHDVGVVVLDGAVPTEVVDSYAQLPDEGVVDTLGMMSPVDLVGYGVQWQKKGVPDFPGLPPGFYPPPPYNSWKWNWQRYYAPADLIQSKNILSSEFLALTANPAKGKGGTTFGDSGGPILLSDTNIVLGINSFVTNYNCDGVTYAQRIDIQDILDWLVGFLD
jgi:hypothetical protein